MLGFMDYVQSDFQTSSNWNRDNSYGNLTATARALLDFPTPLGLCLHLSSLSTPTFATSYTLSTTGLVDGSLSYLYSSLPLSTASKSSSIPLRHLIQGYRQLENLRKPDEPWWAEIWHRGERVDKKDTLLYGRLHLPDSYLEALYLRRISPTTLLKLSTVSSSNLRSGGAILALLSHDVGKYSTEYLYSTDSALLGVRGLYNFGPDPRHIPPTPNSSSSQSSSPPPSSTPLNGLFSAGVELYYGLLNKSGGISTGIRFATLPQHTGFPYTMTLTLNPLMGNLSSTYAVRVGDSLSLCSRFDFNVYSYESDFQVGMELWRRRRPQRPAGDPLHWAREKIRSEAPWDESSLAPSPLPPSPPLSPPPSNNSSFASTPFPSPDENTSGILKLRITQDSAIGLLWEGRAKELLYTCGVNVDFKRTDQIFRGVGLEVRYSS
ncbi:Mitochondrial distribution and morphology protein 10 [Varicellaria rhodocarpa]|nr:Mitochondrial distribution and morphology protein 10 [Varicellaria rhodocarpa]